MDMTYDEYIEFLNHLLLQEFFDFSYHMGDTESTTESLTIL
jgi:hypothetical protein